MTSARTVLADLEALGTVAAAALARALREALAAGDVAGVRAAMDAAAKVLAGR